MLSDEDCFPACKISENAVRASEPYDGKAVKLLGH